MLSIICVVYRTEKNPYIKKTQSYLHIINKKIVESDLMDLSVYKRVHY